MAAEAQNDRLAALDARIGALRDARRPRRSAGADKFNAVGVAWRMVTELVVGVLLGAFIGFSLDAATGVGPAFLLAFTLLGFAAGVRTMLRSADEIRRRDAAGENRRPGAADEKG